MRILLLCAMVLLLLRATTAMTAISTSCHLFVTAVLPGLLPYMVLSSMLVTRCNHHLPPPLLTLLGWCGGSPTGARLIGMVPNLPRRQQIRTAVATATMSPMFLVGTCGKWLDSPRAGWVLLLSVLSGGAITGALAGALPRREAGQEPATAATSPLTFGAAVEQAARTLLMVAGTMAMWGMFATLAAEAFPALSLPLTTLLEVTTGVHQIAALPLPLALRTALTAGATAFGGVAILMQNRAVYQTGGKTPLISLTEQLLWQAVHGGVSFLLALGMMCLA